MLRLNAHLRPLTLVVALVGLVGSTALAAIELNRFATQIAEERIYQMREVQEGLSALHRDLQMVHHLVTHPAGNHGEEAQEFIAARRDQLAAVRWLGHLGTPQERSEVLLASAEMRGYDPRRDPAVASLVSSIRENSLGAAVPGSHRNSASLALVLGPGDGENGALVALVDGDLLLDESLSALTHATAPFDLSLGGRSVGRWPHFNKHDRNLVAADSRTVSVGPLEFTLDFAAPAAATVAGQVLPQPLILLVSACVVAAALAASGRLGRPAPPAAAPPAPVPALPTRELHRTRLWQLGELAASLAHDLGQPLNVIRLTAEAAQDARQRGHLDDARLSRALSHSVDQALRAQAIIDGLVAVARRPGHPPSHLNPVELVRRVLAGNLERLKGQGVQLRWHADLTVPPVLGHRARLEAAVQHVLTNACEALAARPVDCGDAATVWVTCRREGSGVAIEVADNGPGFPPDLLPLLDDPLAAGPERSKGCGLGLTVVLGVATEMGGRLSITDAQPGTRATLLLPPARRSLLLVEDDKAAATALAGYLDSRGWQVRVTHGGNPALALFKDEPADAVITDLHMADGDGWQLIERLRTLSPDLAIIATSTSDGPEARRAATLGAAVVLRKPLSPQEVCDELEGLFGGA